MAAPVVDLPSSDDDWIFTISDHLRDDCYEALEKSFLTTGRGRRPKISQHSISNMLLLQLYLIKIKHGCSWVEIVSFMTKLSIPIPASKYRNLIEQTVNNFQQLHLNNTDDATRQSFLLKMLDFQNAGIHLSKIGIHRIDLLDPLLLKEKAVAFEPCNGVIVDLELFRRKEKLSWSHFFLWMDSLGIATGESDASLKKKVKCCFEQYQHKQRNKGKVGGMEIFDKFMAQIFVDANVAINDVTCEKIEKCTGNGKSDIENNLEQQLVDANSPKSTNKMPCYQVQVMNNEKEMKTMRRELEATREDYKKALEKTNTLQEVCRENSENMRKMEYELQLKTQEIECIASERLKLNSELKICKEEMSTIQHANYYKRLKRKERKIKEHLSIIAEHSDHGCETRKKELKRRVKNVQTALTIARQANSRHLLEKKKYAEQLKIIKLERDSLQNVLDQTSNKGMYIETKDPITKKYTDDIVKCVMELIGEAEVSSKRCAQVIDIVSRQLFNVTIQSSDLPSERSALRFADRGHFISKYHVAEMMISSENFDLHSDGTTKDHRKYVGHQIVTDKKEELSCGFIGVQRENADTLLDIAMSLLEELADIYNPDDKDKEFRVMLTHLTSTMSDRASVMKSFGKKMTDKRNEILQVDDMDAIEILHCNAHFLLGLSHECEKSLSSEEKRMAVKLGRDKHPAFKRFQMSAEGSAARYIRTACDILGPRGDEKSGCRDAWEAFCMLNNSSSKITSYRNNRFNNFFQAAAALHYHRDMIVNFLSKYMSTKNLKLQSVLFDAQSSDIDILITAIGISYFKVTGPYWSLVRSDTQYLDFYKFVTKLEQRFITWEQDASEFMNPDEDPVFPKFELPNDEVRASLFTIPDEDVPKVKDILKIISAGFLSVLRRQLHDFLPEGRYHAIEDEVMRNKMKHCKLTNLLGEACFGDLDFSIFKRRNASLHHHTTINMMKRNRPMSTWFTQKNAIEQHHILTESSKHSQQLRENHQVAQVDVIRQRKEILEENKREQERKEKQKIENKRKIVSSIKEQGGPCLIASDVDGLLEQFQTKTKQLIAIKNEIKYQKVVLQLSNPLLKVTGTLNDLTANLKLFLTGMCNDASSNIQDSHTITDPLQATETLNATDLDSHDACSLKRKSPDTRDSDSDTEENDCATMLNENKIQSFQFEKQGMQVAVYYDEDFYIGEVIEIFSPCEAKIQFLENCGIKPNTFRWPHRDDTAVVHSKYVFDSDFEIHTKNGRIWSVTNFKAVQSNYRFYKQLYCI